MKKIKLILVSITLILTSSLNAEDIKKFDNINIENGKNLYKKCAACHGKNAEKKALNKSQIISNLTMKNLVDSLNGYKDGTYGGSMKTLMKGQVNTYSKQDIIDVSGYINTFNNN